MTDYYSFRRGFLKLFLPLAALVVVVAILVCNIRIKEEVSRLVYSENTRVQEAAFELASDIKKAPEHLLSLPQEHAVHTALNSPSPKNLAAMNASLVTLLQRNHDYDQVRWIGEDGKELVRIVRGKDPSKPVIETGSQLQDKSGSSYFIDTRELGVGQIYTSRITLNIENGLVELPYKPVLRFVTAVADSAGNRRGILVINFLASRILEKFNRSIGPNNQEFMLLNREGYWLASMNPQNNWGFMLGNEKTISKQNPDIWQRINQGSDGHFFNTTGLWTWQVVVASHPAAVTQDEPYWIVLSHQSADTVNKIYFVAWRMAASIALPLLLIFALLSWQMANRSRMRIDALKAAFKAEATASESKQRIVELEQAQKVSATLTSIVQSSDDAIIGKDLDGIIVSWNPGAENMFGYASLEMIGQPVTRLMPADHVDEEAMILAKIKNGESIKHFETIRRRKNGEIFPLSIAISPIRDAQGTVVGASTIVRDITARRAKDAELLQYREHLEELVSNATAEVDAIVQTAVSGIITIDAKGVVLLFNPAAEKLFGWTRQEAVGQNISMLMDEPVAFHHANYLDQYIQTGQSKIIGIEREVLARKKDGSTFPAKLAVGHANLSKSGHFLVGFISDISVQKSIEDYLWRAKEDAEAGARAKAAFIANMSHEIRTPMNAIIGFAEVVLQDTELSQKSAEHVQIVLSSAKALMGIINDILDVSKFESGKFALETVAFHLPNALADALKLVERSALDKGLKIGMEYHAELPLRVMGDPTRVRQVLLNLVGNAIKFTKNGNVNVCVMPSTQANMLHFSVTDTGIGMSPEQMSRIFESFSQADSSTTRRFGGTGLGTTISKQIAELMGGEIWVESESEKGSTFHFTAYLPAAKSIEDSLYEEGSAVVEGYISPRLFKVLLVEDVEANAMLALIRLEQQGHQVEWRQNGEQAVTAYKSDSYDLILMDVMMPVMDGLQATKEIRELEKLQERYTPILALTASIMREDNERCIDSGMDGVLSKPIDFNELFSAMENIVPQGQGQGQLNVMQRIEIGNSIEVNFAPLDGIVDHQKGLKTWRDAAAYAKALTDFATTRLHDAETMEQLLTAKPGDTESARMMAHALKGVAGNLFITKVADLTIKIDADLKSHNRKSALAKLAQLHWALTEAGNAIAEVTLDNGRDIVPKAFDLVAVKTLLRELPTALAGLNPDAIEPILIRLGEYLPKDDLAPIKRAVDAFDFDEAMVQVIALTSVLGLNEG